MLTSVQFCDLLGLALSTPNDLAKRVFHKLSASADGVHPEQVTFFFFPCTHAESTHAFGHGRIFLLLFPPPFRAIDEPNPKHDAWCAFALSSCCLAGSRECRGRSEVCDWMCAQPSRFSAQ